jgi:hypothetical protein
MPARVLVVCVATGFVLSGCGSSGSDRPEATATTTTTTSSALSSSAPDTPEQLAADRALAKRALLRLGDLPAGYKVSKDDSDDDSPEDDSSDNADDATNRRFAECAQLSPELTQAMLSDDPPPGIVDVQSPEFELQSGLLAEVTLDSSVDVGRSPDSVARLLEFFDVGSKPKCFEDLFGAVSEADADGSAHVESVEPADPVGVGDRSRGFRATITVSASGITVPLSLEVAAAQRGRALAIVTATRFGVPVEEQLVRSLLQTVIDRLG